MLIAFAAQIGDDAEIGISRDEARRRIIGGDAETFRESLWSRKTTVGRAVVERR